MGLGASSWGNPHHVNRRDGSTMSENTDHYNSAVSSGVASGIRGASTGETGNRVYKESNVLEEDINPSLPRQRSLIEKSTQSTANNYTMVDGLNTPALSRRNWVENKYNTMTLGTNYDR